LALPRAVRGGSVGATMTTSVFILDDHEVVRRGLRSLIDAEEGLWVAGEAATARAALAAVPTVNPDVALLDLRLPDGNGIDVCRDLLALVPALKCLIYSGHGDRQTLIEAVLAGASGFLLKNSTESDLLAAIRRVAAGEAVLDRTLAPYGVAERGVGTSNGPPFGRLTAQEARVVSLVAKGSSNLQIAEALCLSEKTVKNYLSRVLSKTGFANRTQLAVWVTHQVDGV